ncbi:hypothetical protein IWX90DRAFT_280771 [Phyllosticta citrichinensis]|uniref:Uncharacterized protein n=1 Tax=Phyllosticta citrichinensis TaxID=1130410 RepID=A0ABR1XNR9_9PEZI
MPVAALAASVRIARICDCSEKLSRAKRNGRTDLGSFSRPYARRRICPSFGPALYKLAHVGGSHPSVHATMARGWRLEQHQKSIKCLSDVAVAVAVRSSSHPCIHHARTLAVVVPRALTTRRQQHFMHGGSLPVAPAADPGTIWLFLLSKVSSRLTAQRVRCCHSTNQFSDRHNTIIPAFSFLVFLRQLLLIRHRMARSWRDLVP